MEFGVWWEAKKNFENRVLLLRDEGEEEDLSSSP